MVAMEEVCRGREAQAEGREGDGGEAWEEEREGHVGGGREEVDWKRDGGIAGNWYGWRVGGDQVVERGFGFWCGEGGIPVHFCASLTILWGERW